MKLYWYLNQQHLCMALSMQSSFKFQVLGNKCKLIEIIKFHQNLLSFIVDFVCVFGETLDADDANLERNVGDWPGLRLARLDVDGTLLVTVAALLGGGVAAGGSGDVG